MVDARAAVELSFHLIETNQTSMVDWTLQNHHLNTTMDMIWLLLLAILGY